MDTLCDSEAMMKQIDPNLKGLYSNQEIQMQIKAEAIKNS